MSEKLRYSDAELEEFRTVIMQKLELAQRDYDKIMRGLRGEDGNDVADTHIQGARGWQLCRSTRRADAPCSTSGKVYTGVASRTHTHRK